MKGRKPATFRILGFFKKVYRSKGEKRTIIWLLHAVLILVVANPYFWKICDWYFKNYGPFEAILALFAGGKLLQGLFPVKRERKVKRKGKRINPKKS